MSGGGPVVGGGGGKICRAEQAPCASSAPSLPRPVAPETARIRVRGQCGARGRGRQGRITHPACRSISVDGPRGVWGDHDAPTPPGRRSGWKRDSDDCRLVGQTRSGPPRRDGQAGGTSSKRRGPGGSAETGLVGRCLQDFCVSQEAMETFALCFCSFPQNNLRALAGARKSGSWAGAGSSRGQPTGPQRAAPAAARSCLGNRHPGGRFAGPPQRSAAAGSPSRCVLLRKLSRRRPPHAAAAWA